MITLGFGACDQAKEDLPSRFQEFVYFITFIDFLNSYKLRHSWYTLISAEFVLILTTFGLVVVGISGWASMVGKGMIFRVLESVCVNNRFYKDFLR